MMILAFIQCIMLLYYKTPEKLSSG